MTRTARTVHLSIRIAVVLLATLVPPQPGYGQVVSNRFAYLPLVAKPPRLFGFSLRFFGFGDQDVDRVKIPIDPQVPADVGAADFTLEFWMKANPGDNDAASCSPGNDNWLTGNVLFDRDIYGAGDYGDFGISLFDTGLAFGVHNGAEGAGICGANDLEDGAWHHVALQRRLSDGRLWLYVDGQLQAEADGPDGDVSYHDGREGAENDRFLVIGAEKHDAGIEHPAFMGWIDEVRLSNVLRYDSSFTPALAPFAPDANTVALYHFDEGPAGPCQGAVFDSSQSAGGPSHGECRHGGRVNKGPEYSVDTPQ